MLYPKDIKSQIDIKVNIKSLIINNYFNCFMYELKDYISVLFLLRYRIWLELKMSLLFCNYFFAIMQR